ncbi:MAG: SGNH/GDSL hydrolase family protein [Candidatus Paceibacterota bacterium]
MSIYTYLYNNSRGSDGVYISLPTFSVNRRANPHRLLNASLLMVAELLAIAILTSMTAYLTPPENTRQAHVISPISDQGVVLSLQSEENNTDGDTSKMMPQPNAAGTSDVPLDASRSYPVPPKSNYTIAVIGDSMVDTMGERAEYLEHELTKRYPNTEFTLYNYGKGSQTVSEALDAIEEPFIHMDRSYPPIREIKPDIIIVASWAYNPHTPYDRNKHWLKLTEMVQRMQGLTPEVYLLAEIAPLRYIFGTGPMGVNWETNTVYVHTEKIIEQLENAIGLASALNIPLIDAFTPSITNPEKGGTLQYVNTSDHIHPSVEGHVFMADLIAETIKLR